MTERADQIGELFQATLKLDTLITPETLAEMRDEADRYILDLWDEDIAHGLLDLYEAAHAYVDFARQRVRAGWQPGDSTD